MIGMLSLINVHLLAFRSTAHTNERLDRTQASQLGQRRPVRTASRYTDLAKVAITYRMSVFFIQPTLF